MNNYYLEICSHENLLFTKKNYQIYYFSYFSHIFKKFHVISQICICKEKYKIWKYKICSHDLRDIVANLVDPNSEIFQNFQRTKMSLQHKLEWRLKIP